MLLILLFVVLFAASITFLIISDTKSSFYCTKRQQGYGEEYCKASLQKEQFLNIIHNICIGAIIVVGLALFLCGVILIHNHSTANAVRVELEETYYALHRNELLMHDGNSYDPATAERIKYNATIRNNRRYNDNIWISWFIPDFYDEIPLFPAGGSHPASTKECDWGAYAYGQYPWFSQSRNCPSCRSEKNLH